MWAKTEKIFRFLFFIRLVTNSLLFNIKHFLLKKFNINQRTISNTLNFATH